MILNDFSRHRSIFNPEDISISSKNIGVIGAGATGSHVVDILTKLGLQNITVWDDDIVNEHNIPNQCYQMKHVGQKKVQALYDQVYSNTGYTIKIHSEKIEKADPLKDTVQHLGDIVFLLTDTMSSRRDIVDSYINNTSMDLLIETRMSSTDGRIYTLDPSDKRVFDKYRKTLNIDDDAVGMEVSECGNSITVGPTVHMLAGIAVWNMIHALTGKKYYQRIIFNTADMEFMKGKI